MTVKSLISDHSWCTAKWSRSLTGGGLFERVDRMSLCFFSLPYTMGTMEHIKSLVLDGNPLRSLRRDVVMVMFTEGIKPFLQKKEHSVISLLGDVFRNFVLVDRSIRYVWIKGENEVMFCVFGRTRIRVRDRNKTNNYELFELKWNPQSNVPLFSQLCIQSESVFSSSHYCSTILDKTVEKIVYLDSIFLKIVAVPVLPSPPSPESNVVVYSKESLIPGNIESGEGVFFPKRRRFGNSFVA